MLTQKREIVSKTKRSSNLINSLLTTDTPPYTHILVSSAIIEQKARGDGRSPLIIWDESEELLEDELSDDDDEEEEEEEEPEEEEPEEEEPEEEEEDDDDDDDDDDDELLREEELKDRRTQDTGTVPFKTSSERSK